MGQLIVIPTKDFTEGVGQVEEMPGELCEVPRCLVRRGLTRNGPMYNVSCLVSSSVNLYFS